MNPVRLAPACPSIPCTLYRITLQTNSHQITSPHPNPHPPQFMRSSLGLHTCLPLLLLAWRYNLAPLREELVGGWVEEGVGSGCGRGGGN